MPFEIGDLYPRTGDHFSQIDYRKPIYKNESNKRIFGVCSGIADYLEVSAFSVRLVTLLSLFIFGPFTFWAYIICFFVFDPDPNTTPKARQQRRMHRRQARAERKERRAERKAARRTRKSYVNEAHREDEIDEDVSLSRVPDLVAEDRLALGGR